MTLAAGIRMRRAFVWAWAREQAIKAAGRVRGAATAPVVWAPGGAALCAPAAIGIGAAAYLGLGREPPGWLALCALLILGAAWLRARAGGGSARALFVLAMAFWAAAGFARTDLRAAQVAAPVIAASDTERSFAGWVERIDASSERRRRYLVRIVTWDHASPAPTRVRVSAPVGAARLGERVGLSAVLHPPPSAGSPGAYDFARAAYFAGIGGVGRVQGAMVARPDLVLPRGDRIAHRVAAARAGLAERLRAAAPADVAPVLAALIAGDRSDIPTDVTEDLRAAGLGHILAISGLHMALIGGGAFFTFSLLFASIEPWARRTNPRKHAAAAALLVATAYLVMSGATVSVQRAYIMTAVALVAVTADRRALSLRGVATAAVIVLALRPESAAEPGFQMSFAAACALIAANDAARRRGGVRPPAVGPLAQSRRFMAGVFATSFIAGTATAPIAAYHFNHFATYSLAANMIAMPVFTLIVMPFAALAGLLSLTGLAGPPAFVAGQGMRFVLAVAETAANQDAAMRAAASASPAALALVLGGLVAWCARASGRWRAAGALWLAAAAAWAATPHDHVWIGREGGVAVRLADGAGLAAPWGDRFAAEVFLRRGGAATRQGAPGLETAMRCDARGCVGRIGRRRVAILADVSALAEDCARADIVVIQGRAPPRAKARCGGARLVEAAWSASPRVIRMTAHGPRVRAVLRPARPWGVDVASDSGEASRRAGLAPPPDRG